MSARPWIVLSEPIVPPFDPERAVEIPVLEAAHAQLRLAETADEWLQLAPTADAVLHWRFPIAEHEIDLLKQCGIIAHYGVGVDRIDVVAAATAGIVHRHAGRRKLSGRGNPRRMPSVGGGGPAGNRLGTRRASVGTK